MRQRKAILAVIGLACVGIAGAIPGDPASGEFRVNPESPGEQREPAASIALDGRFVVAWSGAGEGDDQGIYARRHAASGAPSADIDWNTGAPASLRVNQYAGGVQSSPAVTMSKYGYYLVAWTSDGQDGDGRGVYARLFQTSGAPLSDEVRVNDTTTGDQGGPGNEAAAANDFYGARYVVVWGAPEPGGYGVYGRVFESSMAPATPEFRINTLPSSRPTQPSVEMTDGGDVIVAWTGPVAGGNGREDIVVRRFDFSGTPLGDDVAVGMVDGALPASPDIAVDAAGKFVVAWRADSTTIVGQRFDAAGTRTGDAFIVATGTDAVSAPAVAMDRDGDFAVAWSNAGSPVVRAQRFNDDATAAGPAAVVNVAPAGEAAPDLAMDADGDFVVAYESAATGGDAPEVMARRFLGEASIDLSVDIADDADPATSGFSYTVTVFNHNAYAAEGVDVATGVIVEIDLPPGLALGWAPTGYPWDCQGSGPVVCSFADGIWPGGAASVSLYVNAGASSGAIETTAWTQADQADPEGANNSDRETTWVTDTTPDPFAFDEQTEVPRNTLVTSNAVTISGIDAPVQVFVSGGEYSIDGGPFSADYGWISAGQSLQLRHVSSPDYGSDWQGKVETSVQVGNASAVFRSKTVAQDYTPDAFAFDEQTSVERNVVLTSNVVTINGLDEAAYFFVYGQGGEYSLDGGPFTTGGGYVGNGQTIQLRHTSSAYFADDWNGTVETYLSVGDTTAVFRSRTLARDGMPDPIAFDEQVDVPRDALITSNVVTISGLNDDIIVGTYGTGEFSLDGGPFQDQYATAHNGQTLQVRHRSSAQFSDEWGSGTVETYVQVGDLSLVLRSRTLARDGMPDPIAFDEQVDVPRDALITSNVVTISGLNDDIIVGTYGTGEFSLDGGPFQDQYAAAHNGQTLQVRHRSSAQFSDEWGSGTVETYVQVGDLSLVLRSRTVARDALPDAFELPARTNVPRNTPITSNVVTISGLNDAVYVGVSGAGEYAIDGGAFTSAPGTLHNGQTVQVRHTSSPDPYDPASSQGVVETYLQVGDAQATFRSTTEPRDVMPDAFAFDDMTGVPRSTLLTSNPVVIGGLNEAAYIGTLGTGEYSIDGGPFTTVPGAVANGQTVRVRHVSSSDPSGTVVTTLFVGDNGTGTGFPDDFSTTTSAETDTVPDAFAFAGQANVNRGIVATSQPATIVGIDWPAPVSVSGGTYSIEGAEFTSAPGTIRNGQSVRVQHTTAPVGSTSVSTTLNIGGVSATYTTTTHATDTTPDPFTFGDRLAVERSTLVTSPAVTIRGFDDPVAISVANGEYSANFGPFTNEPGTLLPGQSVRLRHWSSADFDTVVTTSATIGGVTGTLTSETVERITTPGPFTFYDLLGQALDTPVTSNEVTVRNITDATGVSVAGGLYSVDDGPFTDAPGTVVRGARIRVQHRTSTEFATAVNTTLTVGGVSDTFTSTTRNGDTRPDAFAFGDVTDVARSTVVTSAAAVITGLEAAAPVTVSGGSYSIDGGAFTSEPGAIRDGQAIRLQHLSSADFSAAASTTVAIGGVSATFRSVTAAADRTPEPFAFTDEFDVPRGSTRVSAPVVVGGIDDAAPVSVSGGAYSIDGGAFTSTAGTVAEGQRVRVQLRSSTQFSTVTQATLTVGGVSGVFSVTTLARDTVPDAFGFPDRRDVARSSEVVSDEIVVSGINDAATIGVDKGSKYSIDGGAFTSRAGTVANGQRVRVRHTASGSFSGSRTTTLTIGGVAGTFTSITVARDATPSAFYFDDRNGAMPMAQVTSNAIVVEGINDVVTIGLQVQGAGISGALLDPEAAYSINGAAFTAAPGTVRAGDNVVLHVRAPLEPGATVRLIALIGDGSDAWDVTTIP